MKALIAGWAVLALVLVASLPALAQRSGSGELELTLQRIGAYVDGYYSRALRIVSEERVRVQPMQRDLTPAGRSRRLVYELRVEWDPREPEPVVVRDLVETDGRPPRRGDNDLQCTDPRLVSPEPLTLLLPQRQDQFKFSWVGFDRQAGVQAVVIDYRSLSQEAPTVTWEDSCVSVDVPDRTGGRIWAVPETGEVLRLDERLTGMFEFSVPPKQAGPSGPRWMALERADTSIRYRPVRFENPDETLMVPASIEVMSVWRNAGTERMRITHAFSNYRRFVTGSRLVDNPRHP